MPTKKAPSKRGGRGAAKRSGPKKKSVGRSSAKRSSGRKAAFLKAPPGTVVIDSKSPLSPYAKRALSVFTAGVQEALKRMAERNVRAMVIENGRRIEAVPTKVGGRWVVTDSKVAEPGRRYVAAPKRRARAG